MIIGKCVRCGSCCLYGSAIEYDVFRKNSLPDMAVFKKVHKRKRDRITPCVHLAFDISTRLAICNNYSSRPMVCRQYPYCKQELIFNNCGFKEK